MAWTLQECMNRNKLFAKNNVKNIEEYNETAQSPKEKYYIKKDGRIINRCIIRNFYSK